MAKDYAVVLSISEVDDVDFQFAIDWYAYISPNLKKSAIEVVHKKDTYLNDVNEHPFRDIGFMEMLYVLIGGVWGYVICGESTNQRNG